MRGSVSDSRGVGGQRSGGRERHPSLPGGRRRGGRRYCPVGDVERWAETVVSSSSRRSFAHPRRCGGGGRSGSPGRRTLRQSRMRMAGLAGSAGGGPEPMCGIAGATRASSGDRHGCGGADAPSLAHRGPDDHGTEVLWVKGSSAPRGPRAQPAIDHRLQSCGTRADVFRWPSSSPDLQWRGLQLRRDPIQLEQQGPSSGARPTPEVILAAYGLWGPRPCTGFEACSPSLSPIQPMRGLAVP